MANQSNIDSLKKKLERERSARKEAERLLEEKSRQLYLANSSLNSLNKSLNQEIEYTSIELAKQRSRYFNLLHNAEDIITISDEHGKINYINPIITKITEYEPNEIIGENYSKLVHPEHRKEFLDFYKEQVLFKIPTTYFEFPVRNKSGKTVWLGQRLIIVETPDSKTEMLGILRDITHTRKREKMLESLTKKLSQQVDFLAAVNQFAVFVMDKHSIKEIAWEVTQNLIKTLRFEDCIIYLKSEDGKDLIQIAAYGDKATGNKKIQDPIIIPIGIGITGSVAKTGQGEIINDTSKDERYLVDDKVRLSVLTIPIISDGEVIGVIDSEHSHKSFFTKEHFDFVTTIAGLIADKIKNTVLLEKQRNSEKLLLEASEKILKSEEKYRRVIENMNLGLMEIDTNGIIINPYKSFCRMTGYSAKELIGKKASDVFLKDETKLLAIRNNAERLKGKSSVYELEIFKKNGDQLWVLISGAPIYGKSKKVIGSIGIHLDITEQKKLEIELQNARLEAERSRDFEKEFLANMSHEIRNPLHSVVGMANLLYDTPMSKEQLGYLDNIKFSTDLLINLVSDILDISKIAEGKMEISQKEFNLRDAFENLKKTFEFKLIESNVVFKSFYDHNIPISLLSDPTYINQIILNLLSNAVKFTPSGSIELHARTLKKEAKKIWIEFLINDTGIGISQEKIDTIFDRFSQAGKVDESKRLGTGLGLSITKQLTELLGGNIMVSSILGEGTTFRVAIPFQLTSKPISRKKGSKKPIHFGELNVLIVEDYDINRHYIEKLLAKRNLKFVSCNNGFEAKEILEQQKFDLILMDVRMPIMDGYQTTIWLRSQKSNINNKIPIIALTASALLDEKEKAIQAGMNHHISKPFSPGILFNAIQELLSMVVPISTYSEDIDLPVGLNKKEILKLYQGDWNHASIIFEIFLKEIPTELNQLQFNIDKSDWIKVKNILHKIKPSFAMVGLGIIESQIQDIEELIKSTPFDELMIKSELAKLFSTIKSSQKIVEKAQIDLSHLVNSI